MSRTFLARHSAAQWFERDPWSFLIGFTVLLILLWLLGRTLR